MQEKKLKAVLFDLDGVVFDTEPQYTKSPVALMPMRSRCTMTILKASKP